MDFKYVLILLTLIVISSLSAISAYNIDDMEIKGACFSTGSGLEDKTYATFYVGDEYSGEDVIIQIYYSRDGSLLNHGNLVPKTVGNDGYFNVKSADSYKYFPDFAEVYLYDNDNNLLDSRNFTLTPNSDTQTFGISDFNHDTSSASTGNTYHTGTSSSYVGNSETGKFHAPGCSDVDKMDNANKVYFSNRQDAVNQGYDPCGHCNP